MRLTWYADDFTGATDALDALTRAGLEAALLIAPPTEDRLAALASYDAVGVAGHTRTLPEDELRAELRPALSSLRALGAPLCHYKVCSTFDSAPHAGSIGAAIEEGLRALGGAWVPLLVGVPPLGRWCVFGNLFARAGRDGPVRRLDRHPVADHPVTPMREADILRHLAEQTELSSAVVLTHVAGAPSVERQLAALEREGARIRLFDVADREDLRAAGAAIAAAAARGEVRFVVGSSGVEYALAEHWGQAGALPEARQARAEPSDRVVVLSGSCSAITAAQLRAAAAAGWAEIALDTPSLADGAGTDGALDRLDAALAGCRSIVVHTALGPADPRVAAVRQRVGAAGVEALVGPALARLGEHALAAGGVRRLVFAGGDTSSAGARALGIEAVEVLAPMLRGAPLCRARAPGRPADGAEIVFKGGGLGDEHAFGHIRAGSDRH